MLLQVVSRKSATTVFFVRRLCLIGLIINRYFSIANANSNRELKLNKDMNIERQQDTEKT